MFFTMVNILYIVWTKNTGWSSIDDVSNCCLVYYNSTGKSCIYSLNHSSSYVIHLSWYESRIVCVIFSNLCTGLCQTMWFKVSCASKDVLPVLFDCYLFTFPRNTPCTDTPLSFLGLPPCACNRAHLIFDFGFCAFCKLSCMMGHHLRRFLPWVLFN